MMKMLKYTDFGAKKKSLLLLYISLIRSKIDYGAEIYAAAAPTLLEKLDKIQYKALRIALGALNSTPTHKLEAEAGVLPLAIRCKAQTVNYWARAQSRGNNPVNSIFGTGHYTKSKFEKNAPPFGLIPRPWWRSSVSKTYR